MVVGALSDTTNPRTGSLDCFPKRTKWIETHFREGLKKLYSNGARMASLCQFVAYLRPGNRAQLLACKQTNQNGYRCDPSYRLSQTKKHCARIVALTMLHCTALQLRFLSSTGRYFIIFAKHCPPLHIFVTTLDSMEIRMKIAVVGFVDVINTLNKVQPNQTACVNKSNSCPRFQLSTCSETVARSQSQKIG